MGDREALLDLINTINAIQQDLSTIWATDNDRQTNLSSFIRRFDIITQQCLQYQLFSASIIENIWDARQQLCQLASQESELFNNENCYNLNTVRGNRGRPAFKITAEQLIFLRGI